MQSEFDKRRRLRELLDRQRPVVAPGVYDCLSARLVERTGFETTLITGAGVAASVLGVPDVGLVTMSEVLAQTKNIARSVDLPVIADCDTGYGNPISVGRTVREFETAGVAALFLEDQLSPKRCGHFDGKQIISAEDMVQKLRAAIDARHDPELMLIARTDARAVAGPEEAVRRGKVYAEAGAEMIFVEAPQSSDELSYVAAELSPLGVPLMVNLVEGGRTPLLSVTELGRLGYRLVTFSGSLQKTAISAMQGMLGSLAEHGDVSAYYPSKMVSLEERSEILGLPAFFEAERRYSSD